MLHGISVYPPIIWLNAFVFIIVRVSPYSPHNSQNAFVLNESRDPLYRSYKPLAINIKLKILFLVKLSTTINESKLYEEKITDYIFGTTSLEYSSLIFCKRYLNF